ncbi:MAG TPA: DUF4251 domain-containing protein [Chitinophagaceae bacterium]|nr:DUF4251 domain-containing protein [Chitinophagaceae bacterium]
MKQHHLPHLPMGIITFLITLTVFPSCTSTQKTSSSPAEIQSAIQDDRWRFTATRAEPMSGSSRQLVTDYWVDLNKDKVIIALPYYGTAQGTGGGYPTGKGPLDFTSTKFSLTKQQRSNGAWQVILKPQDNTEMLSGTFTFFDNGNATLDIVMSGRSSISYSGNVGVR